MVSAICMRGPRQSYMCIITGLGRIPLTFCVGRLIHLGVTCKAGQVEHVLDILNLFGALLLHLHMTLVGAQNWHTRL
jgi:hypothetical protein